MSESASESASEAADLAQLFVEITGQTAVNLPQETDDGTAQIDGESLEEYKRRHDELSRHEALRDALTDGDGQEN